MAEEWYYQAFEQEFGPFGFEELARMLSEGALSSGDLVREGKRGSWTAASSVTSLTERAAEITAETAEVATDIDSFMLLDEKRDPSTAPAMVAANVKTAPAVESRGVWYFQSFGVQFGPVPFNELVEIASRGEVGPEDSVRKGETGQWVPAGLIDGLFSEESTQGNIDDFDFATDRQAAASAPARPSAASRGPATQPASRVQPQPTAAYQAAAPVAAAPASFGWYCYLNDQEIGPVDMTELQGYVAGGYVTPEVYVKYGAEGNWVAAGAVPELYPSATPAVAPMELPATAAVSPVAAPEAVAKLTGPDAERMELAHQLLALLKQEINPSLLAGAAAPVAGGWYCNISGAVVGPVTIDALVQMVLQKRIFADDLIRLGTTGEWFPAKTVPELFPPAAAPGAKKGGADDSNNVLAKIDQMYREAEEAKKKTELANAAPASSYASPNVAAKPVAQSASAPKPPSAGEVYRNMNASIARSAIASPADRKKAAASSSSSGESLGEQLSDLIGKIGLKGKGGLYILIGIVVIGVGAYLTPILMSGMAASSAYDGMVKIQSEIMKAHDAGTDAAAWEPKAKDFRKKIKELGVKVKGGASGSVQRDVARMGQNLTAMAEYAATKPPPAAAGAEPPEDPYQMALEGFQAAQKAAKKKLGKK